MGRTDIVITIKTRSEVKVTVTRKWYATLCHPKMHPQTKFGIPTSKNIGDMNQTRSGTDSVITICLLWGHKNPELKELSRFHINGVIVWSYDFVGAADRCI